MLHLRGVILPLYKLVLMVGSPNLLRSPARKGIIDNLAGKAEKELGSGVSNSDAGGV